MGVEVDEWLRARAERQKRLKAQAYRFAIYLLAEFASVGLSSLNPWFFVGFFIFATAFAFEIQFVSKRISRPMWDLNARILSESLGISYENVKSGGKRQ